MIRTRNFQMLTRPVKKKMAEGGDWDNIMNQINGDQSEYTPSLASIPISRNPISANVPSTTSPMQVTAGNTPASDSTMSSIMSGAKSVLPFASNIVNSFRTPPQPSAPHLDNMVTLRSPSFANERNAAERNINSDATAAARNVDGNIGARIRLSALGQKLNTLSEINQRDSNTSLQTQNEQARINAGISARNNEKLDTYGNQQVEREIAFQRQQSENLSNLSDKAVSMQNEAAKRTVDLQKTRTLATLFSRSGVGDRERKMLRDAGVDDPLGKNYDDLEKKASGGAMGVSGVRTNYSRGFYRNLPIRSQTLKSLYKAPN